MKFISNWLDKWAFNRAERLAKKYMEQERREKHDIFNHPKLKVDPGALTNEGPKTTLTVHKCINGRMLEMWVDSSGGGMNLTKSTTLKQQLYLVREDENLVEVIAAALVAGALDK